MSGAGFPPRRQAAWGLAAALGGLAAVAAALAWPTLRGGQGSALAMGVGSAALIGACGLLGVRRQLLRLRLGSVAAWVSAHNALGLLAWLLALLHCRGQLGGPLTAALLLSTTLLALGGVAGALLQRVVPRVMTSGLDRESATVDLAGALERHRQRFEAVVVDAGLPAVTQLYERHGVAFFRAPQGEHVLANEAQASLAFDALRGATDSSAHAAVDELEEICRAARGALAEHRYLRLMSSWKLAHAPLATVVGVLLVVHVLSILYY